MDKVIRQNTDGLRSKIATDLGISSQGLASKLNAKPLAFLEQIIKSVKVLSEKKALNIYADFRARFDGQLFPIRRKWRLVEVIELWQQIFVSELKFPEVDRFQLLQRWREIVVLGNLRICELTEQLEGKPRFGFA